MYIVTLRTPGCSALRLRLVPTGSKSDSPVIPDANRYGTRMKWKVMLLKPDRALQNRGFTWSDDETALLLKLWGGNDAQSELTGTKRNFVVYEKISEAMNHKGFVRTASQCREKIKRMKREYTVTKQHNEQSKGPKKNMRFYEQFEKILFEKEGKNKKATISKSCPNTGRMEAEIEDETKNSTETSWEVRNERKLRKIAPKSTQPKLHESVEKEDVGNPWTPDVVLVEEDVPTVLFDKPSSASTSSLHENLSGKKKRKLSSQMSIFKCMIDSLTLKFMKYQSQFDKKILDKIEELENEHIAMDERIQKMWLEFEEKRRANEREHELNVTAAFQDIMNQFKTNNT
ncbi:uncharacterized protein CEXT_415461 [Caerostris extrusa]|uniref:Myb/SANT-like DNA-binding domain-containing protein n=1 Tax=Caerostris extrusa TaxID=172846 RepID=A0AAV4N2S6_CAEEX|nr:uncharacterized protein CEXT_415461 [Caerostris extrusa]